MSKSANVTSKISQIKKLDAYLHHPLIITCEKGILIVYRIRLGIVILFLCSFASVLYHVCTKNKLFTI